MKHRSQVLLRQLTKQLRDSVDWEAVAEMRRIVAREQNSGRIPAASWYRARNICEIVGFLDEATSAPIGHEWDESRQLSYATPSFSDDEIPF